MQEIYVLKRGVGINFTDDKKALITVWAPLAEKVEIEIEIKDEDKVTRLSLDNKEYGYWQLITGELHEGDRYRFSKNNNNSFPDPCSLSQSDGVHQSSEAININSFQWNETDWKNIPLEDYIIYEIHPGTFTHEGTFAGIKSKLDYLKELGINAIELMPVAQFPGSRNWGYDGVYPFAVQNSYGGAKGLQQLVDACHKKGIAVILDVVYNHLGPEGNYLNNYGPYFTDKYKTPWGDAINFDDAWCDGVRRYFIENGLMWFRDFHIDALRLDAVHAIKDFSPVHILKEIKLYTDELMKVTGRTHYLIVESELNDTKLIHSINEGGFGMDAQWSDEFHHALRVATGQERNGYYSDFNGLADLAKAYRNGYVYDGQFSHHRKKFLGTKTEDIPGKQFIVFSQNHDHVGNRMCGERTSCLVSFEMQKLMAASVFVSPFLPLLFMGEEWSEPNPFLYFVNHSDAALCDAVCEGRKKEFAAFHSQDKFFEPHVEETFLASKLQWNLKEEGKHKMMLEYYKALIHLRKTRPALKHLDKKVGGIEVIEGSQTVILGRKCSTDQVFCFMNFAKQAHQIPWMNTDSFIIILDSAGKQWNGPQSSTLEYNCINIQPESVLLISKT